MRRHSGDSLATTRGEQIELGDRVATRHNDADLDVASRQTWTAAGIGEDGSLVLRGKGRDRVIPAEYAVMSASLAADVESASEQAVSVFSRPARAGRPTP